MRDLDRRILDFQLGQADRRRGIANVVEIRELRAMKFLAYSVFGARGVLDFPVDPHTRRRIGPVRMGYFVDPPQAPGPASAKRRARWLFQAATHRELVDQVRLWRAHGGDR